MIIILSSIDFLYSSDLVTYISYWLELICCCSVAQLCPTLCNPMDCSTSGFPVLHYLLEFAQTHVCWVSDAIQPSHLLSPPSPPAVNLSQHQGLFQWVGFLHQVAKVLELQHHSFQWIFRVDFLWDWPVGSPCNPKNSQASIFQHSAFFMVQISYLYMTTGKTILLTLQTLFSTVMSLLFNMLSRFVIAFLPRSKHLLISWLLSPSMVILKPKKIESVTVSTFSPSICYEVMRTDAMILVFWMLFLSQIFHSPFSPSSRGSFVHLML